MLGYTFHRNKLIEKKVYVSLEDKIGISSGQPAPGIINIGNGKPTKIKDVIKKISRIAKGGKPQFGKIKYRKDENMKVYQNIKKAYIKLKWKPIIVIVFVIVLLL